MGWVEQLRAAAESTYGKTPYVFGGDRQEGPTLNPVGGWDCSGWVQELFTRIGIDIDPTNLDAYTNAERLRLARASPAT